MTIIPRIRVTRGHCSNYLFSKGEVSLSLFGHCEEVAVQPHPDDWFHFVVESVLPMTLSRRPPGHLHRIAGRTGGRIVLELIW